MVHERALASTVDKILTHGKSPLSVETLAELIDYSYPHTYRAVRHLESEGVIKRSGGRRGVAYSYEVSRDRAETLGLIHA